MLFPLIFQSTCIFSMGSNQTVLLEHKTSVIGADNQGRAISGHLDNGPIVYPKRKKKATTLNRLRKKEN